MGITEPILYGVNLPKRYPLIAACIGGGAGGLFAGLTQTRRFAAGHSGLPALPMYIGEDTLQFLYNILIALAISSVVTALLTIVLSYRFEKVAHPSVASGADHSVEDLAAATASGGVATLTRTDVTELTAPAPARPCLGRCPTPCSPPGNGPGMASSAPAKSSPTPAPSW